MRSGSDVGGFKAMLLRALSIIAFAIAISNAHAALAVPSFEFGTYTENFVVPGSIVTINGTLTNTGDSAIQFSSMLLSQSGSPSQMGGSLPGGSIFSSGLVLGDWAIDNTTFVAFGDGTSPGTASFFVAFNGLVLEPGHSVNFPYATIKVPSGLAPGSDA